MSMFYKRSEGYKGEYRPQDTSSYAYGLKKKQQEQQLAESMYKKPEMFDERTKKLNEAKMLNHITNNKLTHNGLAKRKKLMEAMTVNFFNNIYTKALPLDEDFKEMHKDDFAKIIANKLSESGNVQDVLAKMSKSSSLLKEAADEIKKGVDKKVKTKEESDDISNEDLEIAPDASYEQASDIIKDKVMKVIQDENDANAKQTEMAQSFEDAKAMNEAYGVYRKDPVQRYTLFKSMMIGTYKKAINTSRELNESTMYVSLNENNEIKVDMDMILAEAIMDYTLLEMFNTLRYTNLTAIETQKLSERIAYCRN